MNMLTKILFALSDSSSNIKEFSKALKGLKEQGNKYSDEFILKAIIVTILVLVVLYILYRLINAVFIKNKAAIAGFNILAKANNLNHEESEALLAVAKLYGLNNPVLLFVDRAKIESYFNEKITREVGSTRIKEEHLLENIKNKLFK